MKFLRLLTLTLIGICAVQSPADAMKRKATEKQASKNDRLFNIRCKRNEVIKAVPELLLKQSVVLSQMIEDAETDTLTVGKISNNAMTFIIDCMKFTVNMKAQCHNQNNIVVFELGCDILKKHFPNINKRELVRNQEKIITLFVIADYLKFTTFTQALQLIVGNNEDLFFKQETRNGRKQYIFEFDMEDEVKHLIEQAVTFTHNHTDEQIRYKHQWETLDLIPLEVQILIAANVKNAQDFCHLACTNQTSYNICKKLELKYCNFPPIFAINIHSLSMIAKFIQLLGEDQNNDLMTVNFEEKMPIINVRGRVKNFSSEDALIKVVLLLWINQNITSDLLIQFLSLTEIHTRILDIFYETPEASISITSHGNTEITFGFKDIITTIIFWAIEHHHDGIIAVFESILPEIIPHQYLSNIRLRLADNQPFTKLLTQQVIGYALTKEMPYFLQYLLDAQHEKIAPHMNTMTDTILNYVQQSPQPIKKMLEQTLLLHYSDFYERNKFDDELKLI